VYLESYLQGTVSLSPTLLTQKTAMNKSGSWMSWVKPRLAELPPGSIDTGDWGNWTEIRFPWVSLI
jgi:hypothetical protein